MRCMTAEATWRDSMPEVYDRCLGPALFAPYARHLAGLAAELAPRDVLELAAGTGIVTGELVRALPQASVTATDLNPAMVSWGTGHVPGATWLAADAQHLEFAAGAFDLVVCQFGVMFFPDRPGAFAEAARVLRPRGSLLFATWDTAESSAFPAALLGAVLDLFPDDPPDFLGRVPHGYHDVAAVRRDVESAGLTVTALDHTSLPDGHHRPRCSPRATAWAARCVSNSRHAATSTNWRRNRRPDDLDARRRPRHQRTHRAGRHCHPVVTTSPSWSSCTSTTTTTSAL